MKSKKSDEYKKLYSGHPVTYLPCIGSYKKMRKIAVNYLSTYLLMGEILDHLEHIEPDNEIFFIGF